MQKLWHSYDLWKRASSGKVLVQYLIFGEGEKYQFPAADKISVKADELFLSSQQVPKKIIVEDWCMKLIFTPKTFPTKKDRLVRNQFFQWIIDQTKRAS